MVVPRVCRASSTQIYGTPVNVRSMSARMSLGELPIPMPLAPTGSSVVHAWLRCGGYAEAAPELYLAHEIQVLESSRQSGVRPASRRQCCGRAVKT
jgi:hypothetical protein